MDWTDVEAKAMQESENVCRHLFPNGVRNGVEFKVGSLAGEKGESLSVNLNTGKWSDFAAGIGGRTLLSLWTELKGGVFRDAIQEAKQFLGIRDDFAKRVRPYGEHRGVKREVTPEENDKWKKVGAVWASATPLSPAGEAAKYLIGERKIPSEILQLFQVRERVFEKGSSLMVFPYFIPPSETLAAVKVDKPVPAWAKVERVERENGKKKEWTTPAPEKSLFGMQLSQEPEYRKVRDVVICEGEKDALSWAAFGCLEWGMIPVSVPFGAKWKGADPGRPSPNREWLDRCADWLRGFETVYVAMDNDDPGRQAAMDIINEIGPRLCRLVMMPTVDDREFKDTNECLQAGVDPEVMRQCLKDSQDFAPEKVRNAGEFEEEFVASWVNEELEEGIPVSFAPYFKLRPAELTLWTGIEKSGKTTLLSFLMNELMARGERILVTSLEIRSLRTLKKWSRQAWGRPIKDDNQMEEAKQVGPVAEEKYRATVGDDARHVIRWMSQNLWVYDHVGIIHWTQLLDDIRWARRRHGITTFIVDNFMRIGIQKDDYAQQAEAITAFVAAAMELRVHIHVVAHQNKGENKGKRGVAGAHELVSNAHNILEVQRDENKGVKVSDLWQERKLAKWAAGSEELKKWQASMDAANQQPGGKLILHAQRDGEQQNGSTYLWFLYGPQQYVKFPPGHPEHLARCFVTESEQAEEAAQAKEKEKALPEWEEEQYDL